MLIVTDIKPSTRIATDLRKEIEDGNYRPGQQLPSGTALMATYGVARQTVQNALNQLRAEGLVVSRSGAGVFVRDRSGVSELPRELTSTSGERTVERVSSRFATTADAERYNVDRGCLVFDIARTRYDQNGKPAGTDHTVVPADGNVLVYESPSCDTDHAVDHESTVRQL